jgi:hypothetical protein
MPDTPPVIGINGDNPAVVQIGDTYTDLGATITGPQVDLNLGIATYVNGIETSLVQIDTSAVATDTIDYVATDQNGLAATSTRTVIVEAPSVVPTDDASTTALEESYGANRLAMAIARGRAAGRLAYMNEFIDEAVTSGLVQRAIDRSGLAGTQVLVVAKAS